MTPAPAPCATCGAKNAPFLYRWPGSSARVPAAGRLKNGEIFYLAACGNPACRTAAETRLAQATGALEAPRRAPRPAPPAQDSLF